MPFREPPLEEATPPHATSSTPIKICTPCIWLRYFSPRRVLGSSRQIRLVAVAERIKPSREGRRQDQGIDALAKRLSCLRPGDDHNLVLRPVGKDGRNQLRGEENHARAAGVEAEADGEKLLRANRYLYRLYHDLVDTRNEVCVLILIARFDGRTRRGSSVRLRYLKVGKTTSFA